MKEETQKKLTVANLLSGYRLVSSPAILVLLILHREKLFAIGIAFSYFTDILDGLAARLLHQRTKFGARLDALADATVYALVLAGLPVFKGDFLSAYRWWLLAFAGAYLLRHVVSFARFGRYAGFHLDSVRLVSLLQMGFFITLFAWGVVPLLFYMTVILSVLAFLEEMAVVLVASSPPVTERGIISVLRERRNGARAS